MNKKHKYTFWECTAWSVCSRYNYHISSKTSQGRLDFLETFPEAAQSSWQNLLWKGQDWVRSSLWWPSVDLYLVTDRSLWPWNDLEWNEANTGRWSLAAINNICGNEDFVWNCFPAGPWTNHECLRVSFSQNQTKALRASWVLVPCSPSNFVSTNTASNFNSPPGAKGS